MLNRSELGLLFLVIRVYAYVLDYLNFASSTVFVIVVYFYKPTGSKLRLLLLLVLNFFFSSCTKKSIP